MICVSFRKLGIKNKKEYSPFHQSKIYSAFLLTFNKTQFPHHKNMLHFYLQVRQGKNGRTKRVGLGTQLTG